MGIIIFAILIKIPAISHRPVFSSDESIQGLMAKHIYENKEHPIFEYESWYLGSLKANLAALLYNLTKDNVLALKLSILVFYILVLIITYLFASRTFDKSIGLLSMFFLSFMPGVFHISLNGDGNLMEVLFLGIASFYVLLFILNPKDSELKELELHH